MTRVLLHMCCAPCSVYPLEQLRGEGLDVMGFYDNPNIHPFTEYASRRQAVAELAAIKDLKVLYAPAYDPSVYFQAVSHRESQRCYYCYALRLEAAARYARKGGFEAFTSSLLVSRYQQHDLIREIGEATARRYELNFLYRDFRPGFDEGRNQARAMGLYMQKYCGCLYSEIERYAPAPEKKSLPWLKAAGRRGGTGS